MLLAATKMFDIQEDIDIQMKTFKLQAFVKIQADWITNGIVGQYMLNETATR